ncbi:MAG TPA: Gfo/Idh/MocA family oxidoreductase, partial [bacterium]|nr:Gfo/Idh/MocA family oxidoreductase [bacterium]
VAPYGVPILMEKPFAASLREADAMIAAMRATGKPLAINWPLAWYPSHRTAKRLIDEGRIGEVIEVHYYDGNRGPLYHTAGKIEITPEEAAREKPRSWFYKKAHGGGSLLDYLGYGTTLGTWYHHGRAPLEVTCVVDKPPGLEVDEHSVTVARYEKGLSTFQTRWGTFTDPWTLQPQPKCGFVIVGTEGTLSSYDYEPTVRMQTREHPEGREIPAGALEPPYQNPVQYFIHCLENEEPVTGPLSIEISRVGQRIVDSAALSAAEKRAVKLVEG